MKGKPNFKMSKKKFKFYITLNSHNHNCSNFFNNIKMICKYQLCTTTINLKRLNFYCTHILDKF